VKEIPATEPGTCLLTPYTAPGSLAEIVGSLSIFIMPQKHKWLKFCAMSKHRLDAWCLGLSNNCFLKKIDSGTY
jgi:hypothetical protein